MFKADGERREFPLTRDETIVGRKSTCDLRIPLSSVSRQHFKIEKDGEDLILEDLGSSNGTFYNGERVMEADLEPGDQIRVGPVTFVVVVDGEPDPDSIEPIKTVLPAESGEIEAGGAASAASVDVDEDEAEAIEEEAMTPTIEVDAEAPSETDEESAKPATSPAPAAGTGGDDAEDEAFAALNEDEDAEEDEEAIAALEALAESDEDEDEEEEETPIPLIEEDEDEEKQK